LSQLAKLIIALLYFLVQRLIFDFQLFKIDQVQPVGKLLLFAQHLLLVLQTVPKRDVLQPVLVDLLVLCCVGFFPLFDLLGR
jgi:hypothetical protein